MPGVSTKDQAAMLGITSSKLVKLPAKYLGLPFGFQEINY